MIVALTVLIGAACSAFTLRLSPGDDRFLLATAALALVWVAGAVLAGRLRLVGRGGPRPDLLLGLVVGLAAAGVSLLVGWGAAQVDTLREPAEELLSHTGDAAAVVVLLTLVNGLAEELFFRGALYDALPARWAVAGSTVIYAVVTLGAGIILLSLAALALGLLTALLRRHTGGLLTPITTHLTWSVVMLLALDPVLASGR